MTHRSLFRVVVLTAVALTGIVCWAAEQDKARPASRPSSPASRPDDRTRRGKSRPARHRPDRRSTWINPASGRATKRCTNTL